MRRALRRAAAVVAALICLSGCQMEKPVLLEPERRELTLCFEPGCGERAREAAELFAEKVEAVSGGQMKVTIVEEDDLATIDGMLTGAYDLYFITNGTAAQGIGDYACFTSPYYFTGYEHMSLALNSDRFGTVMDARTRAALQVEPMTAFYAGSRVFIHAAASPITSLEDFETRQPTLIATPNTIMEDMLRRNQTPADVSTVDQILYDFERRRVQLFDFYKQDMDRLVFHERFETVYLVDDFHIVDINWLMLGAATAADLSDYQTAVLAEAAAHALALNDATLIAWEEQMMDTFTDRFGKESVLAQAPLSEEFRALMRESGRYTNQWNWDTYDSIREIAG